MEARMRVLWMMVVIGFGMLFVGCAADTPTQVAEVPSPVVVAPESEAGGASDFRPTGDPVTDTDVSESDAAEADQASGHVLIANFDIEGATSGAMPAPGYAIGRFDPVTAAGERLWRTSTFGGVMFPPQWTLSPDGAHVAYWSMELPDIQDLESALDEDLESVLDLEPSYSLMVQALTVGAEPVVVATSPTAGSFGYGTVWSARSDALWFAAPPIDDVKADATNDAGSFNAVEIHRVELDADGEGPVAGASALQTTLALDELGATRIRLLALDEADGTLALLVERSESEAEESVETRLVTLDVTSWEVASEVQLFETGGRPTIEISPDGGHVAALRYGDGERGSVLLVDLESLDVTDVLPSGDRHPNQPLVWSWGSRWLAWTSLEADGWRIVDVADREAQMVVPFPGDSPPERVTAGTNAGSLTDHTLLAIAPDAPVLLVHSGVIGRDDGFGGQAREHRTVDVRSGEERLLEGLPVHTRFYAWLPQDPSSALVTPYPTDVSPNLDVVEAAHRFVESEPHLQGPEILPELVTYLTHEDHEVRDLASKLAFNVAVSSEARDSGLRAAAQADPELKAALLDGLAYDSFPIGGSEHTRAQMAGAVAALYVDAPSDEIRDRLVGQYWDELDGRARLALAGALCEHEYTAEAVAEVFADAAATPDELVAQMGRQCLERMESLRR
jgi:hypothetical protein